jgi:hypothetical protein
MVKLAELNEVLKNDEDSMYRRIKDIEQENHYAPYYTDTDKARDIRAIKVFINISEKQHHTVLENMQLEITKELQKLNTRKI